MVVSNKDILKRIALYCGIISEIVNNCYDDMSMFMQADIYQVAAVGSLHQIGTLANQLSSEIIALHNGIDWRPIFNLVHKDFDITQESDLKEIWRIMVKEIDSLEKDVYYILVS